MQLSEKKPAFVSIVLPPVISFGPYPLYVKTQLLWQQEKFWCRYSSRKMSTLEHFPAIPTAVILPHLHFYLLVWNIGTVCQVCLVQLYADNRCPYSAHCPLQVIPRPMPMPCRFYGHPARFTVITGDSVSDGDLLNIQPSLMSPTVSIFLPPCHPCPPTQPTPSCFRPVTSIMFHHCVPR